MWIDIISQDDINSLMEVYGGFHDSCITEIHYVSGAFVAKDLAMNAINDLRALRITFQRQECNPQGIEVEFSGLVKLHLEPSDPNYTCEILDVSFFYDRGMLCWGDSNWFEVQRDKYIGTWLQAKSAKWRVIQPPPGT